MKKIRAIDSLVIVILILLYIMKIGFLRNVIIINQLSLKKCVLYSMR